MVINPHHGRESNMAAHPIGAEPYLSPSQPERTMAATHVVRIHHHMREELPGLTENCRKDYSDEYGTSLVRFQTPDSVHVEDHRSLLSAPHQPPKKGHEDADRRARDSHQLGKRVVRRSSDTRFRPLQFFHCFVTFPRQFDLDLDLAVPSTHEGVLSVPL